MIIKKDFWSQMRIFI